MTIEQISAATFSDTISNTITSINSKYDVNIGPIPDLIINPVSAVLEEQNNRIIHLQNLLMLLDDGSISRADIEAFVANEGIKPSNGTPSTVILTFYVTKNSSTDLTIPAGFPVGTGQDANGSQYTFSTNVSATLSSIAGVGLNGLNSQLKRWELQVPATCTKTGSETNISANLATKLLRGCAFSNVTNTSPATGGRDSTTNAELIEQYTIAITGANEATVDGTKRVVRDMFTSAEDSFLVYGNDSLLERAATDAGAVDMWVLGSVPYSHTDIGTFYSADTPIYMLNQPVDSIASITYGSTTLLPVNLGVDFFFNKDASGYSDSMLSKDNITFRSNIGISVGTPITINYVQNSIAASIQATMNTPDKLVLGRDLLVRVAHKVNIAASATITFRSGAVSDQIIKNAKTAIFNFINGLMLGARIPDQSSGGSVQLSDLDYEVRKLSGVDNFTITGLYKKGETPTTPVTDYVIYNNEYPRITLDDIFIT